MSLTTAQSVTAGIKKTFSQSATTAGFNLGIVSAAPSSPAEGDVWYAGASDILQYRQAANTRTIANLDEAQTLTNKTIGSGTIFSAAPTINDGIKFIFNPSAGTAGINVGAHTADPSGAVDGDIIYNSTSNLFRFRQNGAWVVLGGGAQTPWTSDIDADGFDLQDLSNIEFRETTGAPAGTLSAIWHTSSGLKLNAPTGDTIDLNINGVGEYQFSATGLNFATNDITNLGNIATSDTTHLFDMSRITAQADDYTIGELRWRHDDGLAVLQNYARIIGVMESDGNGTEEGSLQIFVTEAGVHDVAYITLNDASSGTVDIFKAVDMNNQKISNIHADTINDLTTVTPVSTDFVMIRDATDGNLKKADVSAFLSAASQTPWTSDIDADGFDLTDLSNIEFRTTTGVPAATVPYILHSGASMLFNNPTGDVFSFAINGTTKFRIDTTEADLNGNNITNIGGTTDASAGGIRLANNIAINWRNGSNDGDFGITGTAGDTISVDTTFVLQSTRLLMDKGTDTGSSDAVTLPADGNFFDITGTTTINHIINTGWQDGAIIILHFDGVVTLTHNAGGAAGAEEDLFLIGNTNYTTAAGDILTFVLSTNGWEEISRNALGSASQTPWSSDIDADGFDLNDLSNILFRTSTGAPAAGDQAIWSDAGGMNFNVPTADVFDFMIQGTTELEISGTTINAPTATFQEGGVDISPIGIHDMPISATAFFAPTLEPATGLTNVNFATNDLDKKVWEFTSTTADERIQTQLPALPRNWNEGAVDIEITWSFASGSGNVRWGARIAASGDNEAIDAAFGTATEANDTAGTANQTQKIVLSSVAVPAGIAAGDELQLEIYREGSDAGDTFTGTARLHGVVIRLTTNAATAA